VKINSVNKAVPEDGTAQRLINPDTAFLLKSTPPRLTRGFLERDRLKFERLILTGSAAIIISAPTGFGKTSLLSQWRRDALTQGSLTFWHTIDNHDTPLRLIKGLSYSAQAQCGKLGFSDSFLDWINSCNDEEKATMAWLAEIAKLSVEVLLLLDEADQLPVASKNQVLGLLLHKAPANLRIALSTRSDLSLLSPTALSRTHVTRITASDLRFSLAETLDVLFSVQGNQSNPESGVKLHELTEGWPFGVQLVVAALQRNSDLDELLATTASDIHRYFVNHLIDHQPPETADLLARLAQLDLIHPDMCQDVLGNAAFTDDLLRLQRETPLMVQAEGSDWMRLHSAAREVLRERLMQLPETERQAMAHRASAWYSEHNLYEEAAEQAFIASDIDTALSLITHHSHHMTVQGRSSVILSWYQRLSPETVKHHPSFWAPLAWALAMSDRHAEAKPLIDLILSQPDTSLSDRFEADLIIATVAAFSDHVEQLQEHKNKWSALPHDIQINATPIHHIIKGCACLFYGCPHQARQEYARIADIDRTVAFSPVSYGHADFANGLSHIWEGRYALAIQGLRPALIRAEEYMDRRSPVASMIAAILAYACWETDQTDNLGALLAGRLIILERNGLPDALISAYKVLAGLAEREKRQDQALNILESLLAIGETRKLPRARAIALLELVKLHSRYGRADTARVLSNELKLLIQTYQSQIAEPFIPLIELYSQLAQAYSALATDDTDTALTAAESAVLLANKLKLGGESAEAGFLRAKILKHQQKSNAQAVYDETLSHAQACGMHRLINIMTLDGHNAAVAAIPAVTDKLIEADPTQAKDQTVLGAGLLTQKEREILTLLNRNFSNKEIARAMDIGEQTVKWHLKNLFSKLDASSRKHVVARARMLGLISMH
jgi:LuxR family transcriptional regulator, maltose regulon positive regulatory protein